MNQLPNEIGDLIVFVGADWKAIEIRILAEYANDKTLIEQFQQHGRDIHCLVGNMLTGRSYEEIEKDRDVRTGVKGFHFSLVYGKTLPALLVSLQADGVKVTMKTLEGYHRKYMKTYTGVAEFMATAPKLVERVGYSENLFGFRRDIWQNDESRNTFWGNQALNTPIQSSAAQLMLMAMALLDQKKRTYNLLQTPVLQIHDSLYFWVRFRDVIEAYRQVKELMEVDVVKQAARKFSVKLRVPLIAEVKVGFNMGSMVEYNGGSLTELLEAWRAYHKKQEEGSWDKLIPGFSQPIQ
jgi:DNA polymerase-1